MEEIAVCCYYGCIGCDDHDCAKDQAGKNGKDRDKQGLENLPPAPRLFPLFEACFGFGV